VAHFSKKGIGTVILIGVLLLVGAKLATSNGTGGWLGSGRQETGDRNSPIPSPTLSTAATGKATPTPSLVAARSQSPNAQSPVGVNLSGLSYWTTAWPFVDVFKINGGWISQREGASWGKGGKLNLTPEGWVQSLEPGQYAEALIFYDNGGHFPGGNYTILYDGEGRIEIAGDQVVSRSPGRMVVNVKPDADGIRFQLHETNPTNPVRNIRVIMPGFENTYQTQPFHPLFLERLSKFRVIRFMDWMETNGSPVVHWSDRTTPNAPTQTGNKGVALEYMIQLANALKADPWFCIPHQATDDYVRQFATMVRDRLDPSLKVRIEYSNEVWNYAGPFTQTEYAQKKGLELGLTSNQWDATIFYYSQRSVEIFKIFEQVFGGNDRLVRILASQTANLDWGEKVLSWKNAYKHADEYAIAAYFGVEDYNKPPKVDQLLTMNPDQIIDQIMLPEIRTTIKAAIVANHQLAQKYGVRLTAYEGGNSLTADKVPGDKEPPLTALFTQLSRHPRMRDVYKEFLQQWKQIGGGLFNQYNDINRPEKWGQWGLLEYQNQPLDMAPEYQGVMDFIDANPTPDL
jgi:hypothetical protein